MATPKRTAEPKRGGGRPPIYSAKVHPEQARKLALLGCGDKEIADVIGVSARTIAVWKSDHPEFLQALTRGKVDADADVAAKLYERALGYSHKAVKLMQWNGQVVRATYVEHYPPDTAAAALWLANRQRGKWSRTPQPAEGDDVPLPVRVTVFAQDASIPEP